MSNKKYELFLADLVSSIFENKAYDVLSLSRFPENYFPLR